MMNNDQNRTAPLRIIVVDDEPDIRSYLSEYLTAKAYRVEMAQNGAEAMELFANGQYHLALIGRTLPDVSGFELVQRAKRVRPELVAVVMSGMPPDSTDELIQYGVDEILSKPITFAELDFILGKYERFLRTLQENETLKQRQMDQDKLKNFFYEAGHQIKTPVVVLKEFAHLFREGFGGEMSTRQQQYMEAIDENINRLLYLVENIENLSKLDRGEWIIRLEEEDPREIIAQISNSWRPILEQRNLQLVEEITDQLPMVKVDSAAVQQVLFNLVDNASKYGPPNGKVTLRCFLSNDGSVQIEVEDQGERIPKEIRDTLFLPFVRLPEHKAAAGLGLGLTVAQSLMQRMDGDLWLASGSGKADGAVGNRFCIRMQAVQSNS